MTKGAAQDLLLLLITLIVIVVGMFLTQEYFRDPNAGRENDWYYERIAPNKRNPNRY